MQWHPEGLPEIISGDDPPRVVLYYWLAENLRELKTQLSKLDPEFQTRDLSVHQAHRWGWGKNRRGK